MNGAWWSAGVLPGLVPGKHRRALFRENIAGETPARRQRSQATGASPSCIRARHIAFFER